MADISNEEIMRLLASPRLLYVEGESDARIIRAWAAACGAQPVMERICFKTMGGGTKPEMLKLAKEHFDAVKQIIPDVKRLMLFDFDNEESAFHPPANNPSLAEWRRKNIENYLLVPAPWRRAALALLQCTEDDFFAPDAIPAIDGFFTDQNLTLPAGRTWRNVTASIFSVIDGKHILFENNDSLFHKLRGGAQPVEVLRERVAALMTADEIHEDVHRFFGKLMSAFGPVMDNDG